MKRYNVTVQVFMNVVVQADSVASASAIVERMFEEEDVVEVGSMEFVIEGGSVTGVSGSDWGEEI